MPGLSYQKTVAYCELLSSTLKPQLEEMPHLKGDSESLDLVIAELKELDSQQQALKARLQEITHLRQDAERRGQSLRSRIAAQIQGRLGFTNESLLAYGINPRKPGRRRAATPETATKDAAQDTAAPSTTPTPAG
ncbi:MAG TPA: hypothetical protein VF756_31535 [Thermoanaerobaculia bacterium]